MRVDVIEPFIPSTVSFLLQFDDFGAESAPELTLAILTDPSLSDGLFDAVFVANFMFFSEMRPEKLGAVKDLFTVSGFGSTGCEAR